MAVAASDSIIGFWRFQRARTAHQCYAHTGAPCQHIVKALVSEPLRGEVLT
jgi:hypothetical protein